MNLQAELDNGAAIAALRRFNNLLAALPAESWGERRCRTLPKHTSCTLMPPHFLLDSLA